MNDPKDWRSKLPQLDGFPLIPCGAGSKFKAPIDHTNGQPLKGWEKTSFSPEQIAAMNGVVLCVGTRCGPDADHLLILDIDGASAIDAFKKAGCSTKDVGWAITRNSSKDRLKVAFRIPPDLRHFLQTQDGPPLGKVVMPTKAPVPKLDSNGNPERDENNRIIKLEDQEQLELFYGTGQCIVLGEHKESGGHYQWQGNPQAVKEPTPEWWGLITQILEHQKTQPKSLRPKHSSGSTKQSGPGSPCPICDRDTSGACTTYTDGDRQRVNCFDGQSFSYLQAVGPLKKGETTSISGITWAFTGDGFNPAIGGFGTFIEHQDRPLDSKQNNDARLAIAATPAQILHAETLDELLGPIEDNKLRRPRTDLLTKALDIALPLQFNLLTQRIENAGEPIDGDFLGTLYIQLAEQFQIEVSKNRAADAAVLQARRNSYHPVQDYLSNLNTSLQPHQWDELAFEIFGITDRTATLHLQKQLIGLVARAITPGAKLDTALVIHSSKQGIGKSTMWSILGGPWFSDSLGDLRNLKDDILQLHSAWIHEWGEIDAVVGKRESETLKKFLSATKDDVRKPYGRGVESLTRSCGIVGTTNRSDFIKDPTGNRRFPVISVDRVNTDWVRQNRDAIWGSALNAFKANAPWHYDGAENVQITRAAQSYSAEDPLRDQIETWMEDNPDAGSIAMPVLIYHLNPERQRDQEFSRQISLRLTALGWTKSNKRERGYLPNGDRHDKATYWTAPEIDDAAQ